MAPRTRIVKLGALLLSQFGLLAALNFQLFWNSLQDDGTEAKPVFGCISLSWKDVFAKKENGISSRSPSSWFS